MSITSNSKTCFHVKTMALHQGVEKAEDRDAVLIDAPILATAFGTQRSPAPGEPTEPQESESGRERSRINTVNKNEG
jgi:hypothetical protein